MPAPKPTPPLHTRYRAALVNRILMGVLLPPVLLVMLWALVANWPAGATRGDALLATGCILLIAAFALHVLVATFKDAILLTDSHIIKKSTWPLVNKELRLDELAGFRTTNKLIIIESTQPDLPKLSFQSSIDFHDDFMFWLGSNYPDLDQVEAAATRAALLADEQLGATPEVRVVRLALARQVSWGLNILGIVVGVWLFIQPQPYAYAVAVGLAVPLLAAGALFLFPKLLRVEPRKNSPQTSLLLALLLPGLGLVVSAAATSKPLAYSAVWPLAGGVAVVFGLLLLIGSQPSLIEVGSARRGGEGWLLLLICAALYGFGATLTSNAAFDTHAPILYRAQILSKHTTTGKSTSYHLLLNPWGPRIAPENVTVGREYYQRKQPGDTVTIATQPGRLGIPWFRVVEE